MWVPLVLHCTKVWRCNEFLDFLIFRVINERCESIPMQVKHKWVITQDEVNVLKHFQKVLLAFGWWQTVSIKTWWRAERQRTKTSRKHLPPTAQSSPFFFNQTETCRVLNETSSQISKLIEEFCQLYSQIDNLRVGTSLLSRPWKWWRLKNNNKNQNGIITEFSKSACVHAVGQYVDCVLSKQ